MVFQLVFITIRKHIFGSNVDSFVCSWFFFLLLCVRFFFLALFSNESESLCVNRVRATKPSSFWWFVSRSGYFLLLFLLCEPSERQHNSQMIQWVCVRYMHGNQFDNRMMTFFHATGEKTISTQWLSNLFLSIVHVFIQCMWCFFQSTKQQSIME